MSTESPPLVEDISHFVDTPFCPQRTYTEILRALAARNWVKKNRDRGVKSMSLEERACYNQLVLLETFEVAAVVEWLRLAKRTSSRGPNNIVWIQGHAATGKSTLALEAAAAFCDPDSIGHMAVLSESEISYAHVPVAIISGADNHLAGVQSAACEWLGLGAGRSGDDSGTRFAEMLTRCRTRVLIIDDMQTIRGGARAVHALRVLLNKLPTVVIAISLPPRELDERSLATELISGSPAAQQHRSRMRILRLGSTSHMRFDDFAFHVSRRLSQFKLLNPCHQEQEIIEYLWAQSSKVERVKTPGQIYNLLGGVASAAVGCEEAVTLPAVMAATCD